MTGSHKVHRMTSPTEPTPSAEAGQARLDNPEAAVLREAESVIEQAEPAGSAAMDLLDSRRRMLLVHAHPDDVTIGNGVTMAKYAAAGSSRASPLVEVSHSRLEKANAA
ncbi:MAG: hypothetical protein QOJ60_1934, partial [Actinomycetota bacterium]|nr:hypothetical protein [Actinomycetota bacterium]